MNKAEACKLLQISPKTLGRWMRNGKVKFTRTGTGQFAECEFTLADLGLSEPLPVAETTPEPEPASEVKTPEVMEPAPEREPSDIDLRAEADKQFAQAYLSGEATDSNGNTVDGGNKKFPSIGTVSLLGPMEPRPVPKPSATSHMNPALLSDWRDPNALEMPAHSGLSQSCYENMMEAWRRQGGGRSQAEFELASRRSQKAIHAAFPRGL